MKRLCFLVLSFLLVTVLPAAADDMARNLRFSPGSSGAVVSGRIQGYDTATYLLSVRGGQRLLVAMSASNPQNYFNIIAPMGNQIHNSSMGDDNFSGVVRQTGTYRIQVYLMRAAARRGEESRYKLSVTVPSGGVAASAVAALMMTMTAATSPTAMPAAPTTGWCAAFRRETA